MNLTHQELRDVLDALDYGIKERAYDFDETYTIDEAEELEALIERWIILHAQIARFINDYTRDPT